MSDHHGPGEASNRQYYRGCRCPECRAAHAAHQREWAARNVAKVLRRRTTTCPDCGGRMTRGNGPGRDPERCAACRIAAIEPPHGTLSRYTSKYRCRCVECRAANTAYYRELRARRRAAA